MFNCEICNFETSHKSNYTAHIKTKRHLTKIEITSENPPKTSEKIYSCNFCNNEYTRLDNLNRHQKCCVSGENISIQTHIVLQKCVCNFHSPACARKMLQPQRHIKDGASTGTNQKHTHTYIRTHA